MSLLLALPPELKLDDTLQSHILRRHKPAFLRVVNANTGAPMGASALKTRLASLQMKVYAKLGVPGYQPYERLGLWLAQDLKPLVHRLLLSDRFLARGLFVPEAVARIVVAARGADAQPHVSHHGDADLRDRTGRAVRGEQRDVESRRMKGLILTYLVTFAGSIAALRYPLIGLQVYVGLAVLRPRPSSDSRETSATSASWSASPCSSAGR